MSSEAHNDPAGKPARPAIAHWHSRCVTKWQESEGDDGRRRWLLLEPATRYAVQEFRVPLQGGGSAVSLVLEDLRSGEQLATFVLLSDAMDAAAERLEGSR